MAHFVKLDENNQVIEVIVVNNEVIIDENGNENEELGVSFCKQLFGQDTTWIQASYNGNFRKRYPAFGDTYNEILDAFITPKPYPSWILNSDTCDWEAPIPKPWDTYQYEWDESISNWRQVEGSEGQRDWTLNMEQPEFDRRY
jgi:hypothetical protein